MLYNLLIYENMIGKIRNKLIKQLINKPRFLFSSFIVNNPTTGKPCASFPKYEGNAEMVSEEKVMKEGLAKWKKLNVEERKQKMTQFCDAFQQNKAELVEIVQSSTGKHSECAQWEIQMSIATLRQDLKQKYPQKTAKKNGIYYQKAFGNILIVCDYRMVSMSCVKYLISCGVAGNCLILNPHRYGLPIGKRIESIWRTVLPQYPLIYCPINNFTDGLEFHVQKSDMGFVSFTGDVEAGNAFYHFIAQKSEILAESEFLLMSSDTAYVLKDVTEVQLRKAAENLATAAFMGGGNLFNSVKRIYVDRELLSKFIQLFVESSKKYTINQQQSKASPIITSDHISEAKKSIQQFQQYKENDMKLLTEFEMKESYKSLCVSPIIYQVDGIPSIEYWNSVYPFPVCFVEGVESKQSAIQQINASLYGNTSVIYTNDISKMYEIGEQLEVGVVHGNRWGLSPGVPYSPRKRSGKGQSFSVYSFPNVVKLQSLKGISDINE